LLIAAGLFFLIADQVVKLFITSRLSPSETIPVIENIFHITLVFNNGCAFGLFKGQPNVIFFAISISAVIFLTFFLIRLHKNLIIYRLAAILMIAGALSNLIDRLRVGYVIDFLDFRIWPVFNLGDTAITIGVSIFIVRILMKSKAKRSQS